jgi:hypothetical protein
MDRLEMRQLEQNGNEERHTTGNGTTTIKMVWPHHENGGLQNC